MKLMRFAWKGYIPLLHPPLNAPKLYSVTTSYGPEFSDYFISLIYCFTNNLSLCYTGVCFLSSEHLLTTSVDQRLTLWTVELSSKDNAVITDKEIILERNRVYLHDVADVAALYAYHIR